MKKILKKGDVLVLNNSKVIPTRMFGKISGKKIELLLLEKKSPDTWTALAKPGKKLKIGSKIILSTKRQALRAKLSEKESLELSAWCLDLKDGIFTLRFNKQKNNLDSAIDTLGESPTPPYIKTPPEELAKYQTIYAKSKGSVAAPTAGFHFTKKLLKNLKNKGVQIEYITLHVGLGTFQPVREKVAEKHKMHSERFSVTKETLGRILMAKKEGRRIIAVGTTTCRVLESLSPTTTVKKDITNKTALFILPGYKFKMVDALITNFHLPKSTLIMLVPAFIGDGIGDPKKGIEITKKAYEEAVKKKYRFYSFGDAMAIL